jgi:hypothetical protein
METNCIVQTLQTIYENWHTTSDTIDVLTFKITNYISSIIPDKNKQKQKISEIVNGMFIDFLTSVIEHKKINRKNLFFVSLVVSFDVNAHRRLKKIIKKFFGNLQEVDDSYHLLEKPNGFISKNISNYNLTYNFTKSISKSRSRTPTFGTNN